MGVDCEPLDPGVIFGAMVGVIIGLIEGDFALHGAHFPPQSIPVSPLSLSHFPFLQVKGTEVDGVVVVIVGFTVTVPFVVVLV